MSPKSSSQLLLMYVKSTLHYLGTCIVVSNDFGSQRQKYHASDAADAILNGIRRCTRLQPTDATSIIELLETELLTEKERDVLVNAIRSKTNVDSFVIDDTPKDEDGNQECNGIYWYLTQSGITGLASATSQHEAIQVLVGRMLALKLTHCTERTYLNIAADALWLCKTKLGNPLELTHALKQNVTNRRPKQREAGTPTVYPESPAGLLKDHADLFKAVYAEEPPFSVLPFGFTFGLPSGFTFDLTDRYAPSCGNPSSSSAVHQQGMAMRPAAMSPVSVASSSMHTAPDTPSPPPRQNQSLQPQPPLARVTRKDLDMHARLAATTTPLTKPGYSDKPG